ncbi:caspase-3-like isoform X2 [Mytilus californianus]|uniref:caspase-3-like isoform X2 n=1 Tax=Mytilus californianus TaxID=6549 RepID=UPI0022479047|nr:caspase-3-like isoform X2 [Mytilus californianus]
MDWKKAFAKNRVEIVRNLANPNDVAGCLFSDRVFTEEMRDGVQQELETEQKNRMILDTLHRRGQRSVKSLYNAFQETGNDHLADLLLPYAKIIEQKENFNDPKDNATEKGILHEADILFDVYRLCWEKRGKVFIMNNKFSNSTWERHGSDVDVKNLTDLFQELHFEVVTKTDTPAKEMFEFLIKERNKIENWKDIECIVLILMSHGTSGYIYGSDRIPIKLSDLTYVFDSEHCIGLDDKPRLVFVQACRGVTDQGKIAELCVKVENQKIQPKSGDELDSETFHDEKPTQVKHPSADFFIVYATPEGTSAYRHIESGSWFLNAVVWTFKYHAKREELQHLLIRVNRLVAKGKGSALYEQKLTVSEVKSNLRKKFYFFPGVYGESPQFFNE